MTWLGKDDYKRARAIADRKNTEHVKKYGIGDYNAIYQEVAAKIKYSKPIYRRK